MGDTSVTKVESKHSPRGEQGQKYLAAGVHIAMRLWEAEPPGEPESVTARNYEAVGYVIDRRAELHIEGQMVLLTPGTPGSYPGAHRTCTSSSSRSRPSRRPARRPSSVGAIGSEPR